MIHEVATKRIALSILLTFVLNTQLMAASDTSEGVSDVEEVVVIASRLTRPDESYSNPVFSLDSANLQASGIRDLSAFMQQIPALAGSLDSSAFVGGRVDGANGATALNLRSLGVFRTLVLVNGRRYIGSPIPGAAAVDIDTLPVNLIERVEVMTGGASALYGADGVSGVVNIVMQDKYEGFEISGQSATSGDHDAQSNNLGIQYGTGFANDRGHISGSLEYVKSKGLHHQQRDFTSLDGYATFVQNPNNPNGDADKPDEIPLTNIRFAESSRGGSVDITFDAIPEFDGDGSVWDEGLLLDPIYQQGGDGAPVVEFLSDLLPEKERYTLNLFADYNLSDSVNLFSEFAYTNSDASGEFEPIFDFVLVLPSDSPFVPANISAAAVGNPLVVSRDSWDMGVRSDDTNRETIRFVLGAEGDLSDRFKFDLSYTFGETDVEINSFNDRYNDRFAAALDTTVDPVTGNAVCASELDPTAEPFNLQWQEWNQFDPLPGTWAGSYVPGQGDCVPINTFGEGAPSQAALDWIMLDTVARANLQQQVIQGYITGDTAGWLETSAGPAGVVAGFEWRKDKVNNTSAEPARLGLTNANKGDPDRASRTVAEVFAEIDVPLVTDAPLYQIFGS